MTVPTNPSPIICSESLLASDTKVVEEQSNPKDGIKWTKLVITEIGLAALTGTLVFATGIAIPITWIVLPQGYPFNTETIQKIFAGTGTGLSFAGLIGFMTLHFINESRGSWPPMARSRECYHYCNSCHQPRHRYCLGSDRMYP